MLTPQTTAALEKDQAIDAHARRFVEYYEATVRPLEIEANRLSWIANVTGKDADYQKKQAAEDKLDLCLSDPQRFAELKAIKDAGVRDPLLARQIAVLYLEFLGRQVPPELLKKISAKSNAVERTFNVYRLRRRRQETDRQRHLPHPGRIARLGRAAGRVGSPHDHRPRGRRRSQGRGRPAQRSRPKLGFKNYHAMQLYLNEQSDEQVLKLFDELDELTREPFARPRPRSTPRWPKSYGITVEELRPWHYHDPFFAEVPAVLGDLPESVYKPIDILKLAARSTTASGCRSTTC